MMAGAAHDPVFAKKVGVPGKVAKDFNKADDRSGFLSSAMRAKGPAYQEGGKVSNSQKSRMNRRKFASGGSTSDKLPPYRRVGGPPIEEDLGEGRKRTTYPRVEGQRSGDQIYRDSKGKATVTDTDDPEIAYSKGRYPGGKVITTNIRSIPQMVKDFVRPVPTKYSPGTLKDEDAGGYGTAFPYKAGGKVKKYAKGGSVKGGGCEKRGTRPAKFY